jgi:ribosomal protein S2
VFLLAIDFSFYKKRKRKKKEKRKEKRKKKKKRKEGIKELKQKPHAIIVTWSYLSSMTKFF